MQFHDKIGKRLQIFLNICFLEQSEEFSKDSRMSSN